MEKVIQETPHDFEAMLARLKAEHQALEARLSELERHISLTPDEQIEVATIKKMKLAKKDLIAQLARRSSH